MIHGEERDVTVILRFPSPEVTAEFSEDPEDQPWQEIRLASTTNRASIMIGEFDPSKF